MKIVFQNVLGLLFFVVYQYLCLAKDHVQIGVLFSEFDSQSVLPLNTTTDPRFSYNKPVNFFSRIKQVSDTDSYEASNVLCDLLGQEGGLGVVFGPSSPTTAPILESICSNYNMPFISTSWRDTNFNDKKTSLNFFPEAYLFAKGVAEIIKNEEWTNFVILYETEEGLIRLQEVLKLQEFQKDVKKNNIVVKQLGSGPDYRPLLKQINNTEGNIILDCKSENILPILLQAKELKMVDVQDNYLLTSLDAHTIDFSVLSNSTNIITLRLFDPDSDNFKNTVYNWEMVGFEPGSGRRNVIDPKTIKSDTALFQDAITLFTETINELYANEFPIQTESLQCDDEKTFTDGKRIRDAIISKSRFFGITGPITFDEMGNRVDFNLYAVDILKEQTISTYFANNQSVVRVRTVNDTIDAAVQSLQKVLVIVSSRLGPPYLMYANSEQGKGLEGNARYMGFSMDLIDAVAKIIGFKYEFRLAEDGKYGNYDKHLKKWTGLLGDLLDRKAHLAICDLTTTHERREVVDFSMPFMTLGISILYKKPDKKDINMFAFLEPFHVSVWIYTATLYLVISIVLYFISRMTPGDWENPHPCDERPEELENIWGIKNCLWLTLGSIMTQGCDILPKGISSRMAVSMWWFFSLIMTSSYTANLAAFLTRKNMEVPIDGAEALAKQTKIKYGVMRGGSTESFFRNSNFSTYQRMWNNMKESKPEVFVDDNKEGVNRVLSTKNSLYAYLMESTGIEYEIETNCKLKQIGSWLDTKSYGIAMPMNAPYRSAINSAVLKLQESGQLAALKTKWWKEKRDEEKCDDKESDDEEEGADLALANVGGVFLVLGIGIAMAIVLAILEFLWNVRNVSVEEHLTYWEALKVELKFACNIWITKKRTKPLMSESSSSARSDKTDNKSMIHSILQNASSFMNLNNFSNRN